MKGFGLLLIAAGACCSLYGMSMLETSTIDALDILSVGPVLYIPGVAILVRNGRRRTRI